MVEKHMATSVFHRILYLFMLVNNPHFHVESILVSLTWRQKKKKKRQMQKGAVFINLLHLSNFLTSQCPYISYPHQKSCNFSKGSWTMDVTSNWKMITKSQPRVATPFENEKQSKSVSRNNTFILFLLRRNYSDIHDGKSMVWRYKPSMSKFYSSLKY